ncbi:hypothetical protein WJX75_003010 [Coccomyxa subellipsoidea]|uniref:CHRD domain-containing protein n=1 Tax=Coccomyxa subellipsoidea TaxID=248742 RepID=A0ABR2YKJ9_9CHLO
MPQNEVPGVPNSGAMGYAALDFMPDMNSISYKVVVSNIYGPTASHIHAGAMGANGPVIAFLYNATGPVNSATATFGTLSSGTLTPASFIGPAKGMSVKAFVDMYITPSMAYVNVHTTMYPNGNIRGQISHMPMPMSNMMMAPTMAPMPMPMAPMPMMMGPMPMPGMPTTAGRRMLAV